jgi:hypothetical protein
MTHCRLGDLAITINCDVQENLGRFVRVIGIKGLKPWRDKGEVFVWEVEAISEASPLIYKYDQCLIEALRGPVPDIFLRPIRGEGNGAEEANDLAIEQTNDQVQDIDDLQAADLVLSQLSLHA